MSKYHLTAIMHIKDLLIRLTQIMDIRIMFCTYNGLFNNDFNSIRSKHFSKLPILDFFDTIRFHSQTFNLILSSPKIK